MKASNRLLGAISVAAAFLGGCAGTSPLEATFGDSVREMQLSQRYMPANAEIRPQGHGPADPGKAAGVLGAYRKDISKPEEVTNEIRIRLVD